VKWFKWQRLKNRPSSLCKTWHMVRPIDRTHLAVGVTQASLTACGRTVGAEGQARKTRPEWYECCGQCLLVLDKEKS
jgi:hypothetical protein